MSVGLPDSGASRSDLVFGAIRVEQLILHSLIQSQYRIISAAEWVPYLFLKLVDELRILFFEAIVEQD
jgi:hypothetical protein